MYWLSLATTFLVFGFFDFDIRGFQYDLSPLNLVVQGIGAQVFLPAFKIPAMWYIGAIWLFYLIYAGFSYIAKDNLLKFSIGTVILFIFLNFIQITGYLDERITYFFFVFIAGVLTGKALLNHPLILMSLLSGLFSLLRCIFCLSISLSNPCRMVDTTIVD